MKILALTFLYWIGLLFTPQEQKTYCVIHLQNFFQKDLVSMKFGTCIVAQEVIVTSDTSSGLSNLTIDVFKGRGDSLTFKSSISNKEGRCKYTKKGKLQIEVVLNSHSSKFCVDIKKGKYIGFEKKNDSTLNIWQSKDPFYYQ